jgi:hypothetical protein
VTLEEIENASSFVENLEELQLPSQLVAVLADPLLQKLLLLRPEEEALRRVHYWVLNILQDIRCGEADGGTIGEVLGLLYEYVVVVQVRVSRKRSARLSADKLNLGNATISSQLPRGFFARLEWPRRKRGSFGPPLLLPSG